MESGEQTYVYTVAASSWEYPLLEETPSDWKSRAIRQNGMLPLFVERISYYYFQTVIERVNLAT